MTTNKIKFDKCDGSYISEEDAACKKDCHLKEQEQRGIKNPILSQFFGKHMLKEMLKRKKAVGIRISYGADDDGKPNLVLMPLDKFGNEIFKDNSGLKDAGDSSGSDGPTCPDRC